MGKYIDLTGRVYHELTVIKFCERITFPNGKKRYYWWCRCSCGVEKRIVKDVLGKQRRCGHCYGTHKMTKSREYKIWVGMIQRCHNPKFPHFKHYGGRGISVCDRWRKSFIDFFEDVGLSPTNKHSLGRLDNNGNYQPDNVEWQDQHTQMLNTSRSRIIEYRGLRMNITELCKHFSINFATIHNRIRRGMTVDEAFSKPIIKKKPWKRLT